MSCGRKHELEAGEPQGQLEHHPEEGQGAGQQQQVAAERGAGAGRASPDHRRRLVRPQEVVFGRQVAAAEDLGRGPRMPGAHQEAGGRVDGAHHDAARRLGGWRRPGSARLWP